jgi:predicted pyridoxine 5'-phosphate oxidase superfamily flavin-nucleotide-binding protein
MAEKFLEVTFTDAVRKAQENYFGKSYRIDSVPESDPLTNDEMDFIKSRDSFYFATVNELGWPYVQHRGGQPGFLHVTSRHTLAFADYRGNRQLLSTGNLSVNDRVCLFLMDYPNRTRLKILGHARVEDAREHSELVTKFAPPGIQSLVERVFLIKVVSFDWNCPKYITPRYTEDEIEKAVRPLHQRIAQLEAQLKSNP